MHSIDPHLFTQFNGFYTTHSVNQRITSIKYLTDEQPKPRQHKLFDASVKLMFGSPSQPSLTLDSQLTVTEDQIIFQEPLNQLAYVQFGISRSFDIENKLPGVYYTLLLFVKFKDQPLFGLADNVPKHYTEYASKFASAQVPIEDPFDLASVNFTDDSFEKYMRKKYDQVAPKNWLPRISIDSRLRMDLA